MFRGAHLEGAKLQDAHIGCAYFGLAHLEGADLSRVHLAGDEIFYLGDNFASFPWHSLYHEGPFLSETTRLPDGTNPRPEWLNTGGKLIPYSET